MSESTAYEKMLAEEYYHPDDFLAQMAYQCSKDLLYINSTPPRDPKRDEFLKSFFGGIGEHVTIKGNFHCDYGKHILLGNGCIINCNVTILDTARVKIGNDVFLAPGVVISAATHPIDAQKRVDRNPLPSVTAYGSAPTPPFFPALPFGRILWLPPELL